MFHTVGVAASAQVRIRYASLRGTSVGDYAELYDSHPEWQGGIN